MATCDHPSDLVRRIAYPTLVRPGWRIDPRRAALPAESEEQLPVRSNLEGKEVGDIFYLVDSRPRNPWAAIGSLAFMSVLLLALIVIPLFHMDPLPKRETLTMLYLQPPPAAAGNAVKFQPPQPASTYSSTSIAIPPQCIRRKKRHHLRSAQAAEWSAEFPVEWSAEFPVECSAKF